MDDQSIPLLEMIQALRNELAASMYEGKDQPLRFQVDSVELELQVKVTREKKKSATGHGGVEFWVVSAGAEGAVESAQGRESVHTIKLKLQPVLKEGDKQTEVLVGAKSAQLPR